MGADSGGGTGPQASPSSREALLANIESVVKQGYPLTDGRFGRKTGNAVNEIITSDPFGQAWWFFTQLGAGGKLQPAVRTAYGEMRTRLFDDGSTVTYRKITRSSGDYAEDNPAVGITFETKQDGMPRTYRIHFRRERTSK